MRPASRFLAKIGFVRFWSAATVLPFWVSLASEVSAQTTTTYTIPANSMPWVSSASLNASYPFGVGDGIGPVVIDVSSAQGQPVTVQYLSGTSYPGCCNFYFSDANGNTNAPVNGGTGASGKFFPSHYMMPYPINLIELVGTFADDTGAILGAPFAIGDGPTSETVPPGATQLQLGVNDDIFSDNQGSWDVSVTIPDTCPGNNVRPDGPTCPQPPGIYLGGVNIAGSSEPTHVTAGDAITLSGRPRPTANVPAWSVPGAVKDYKLAPSKTRDPMQYASGSVVEIGPDDESKALISFHFYQTDSKDVTYTYYDKNGVSHTLTANFFVDGPENGDITAITAPETAIDDRAKGQVLTIDPNMLFQGDGKPTNAAGSFFWLQIVGPETLSVSTKIPYQKGKSKTCQIPKGLDNDDPYAFTDFHSSPTINLRDSTDQPSVLLSGAPYDTIFRNFQADMYLMWQSPAANAIAIPLGSKHWSFDALAIDLGQSWTTISTPVLISPFSPTTDSPKSSFPHWNVVVVNGDSSQCR